MIEILIVDDQKVVREQLSSYFADKPDLQVIATAKDSIDALSKIDSFQPDVVFMDVKMPGRMTGLDMTQTIKNNYPETKVIIFTGHYTDEIGRQADLVGAAACLEKNVPAKYLIEIVRNLCPSGELTVSASSSIEGKQVANSALSHSHLKPELLATDATPLYVNSESKQSNSKPKPKLGKFLFWGIGLNGLVWVLAFAYLKLTPPTYTSQWGVKILEIDSGVEVVLPDGGRATPSAGGWSPLQAKEILVTTMYI